MSKFLSDLISAEENISSIQVNGLTSDSRDVLPGFIFAALPGKKNNGKSFICDAIKKGAVAVIAETGTEIDGSDTVLITSDNPRSKYAKIASKFYKEKPDWLGAVTGTNGKTSVANFTFQLWKAMNLNGAAIGTLGINSINYRSNLELTTPEPVTLHKELSKIYNRGLDYAVIEASSHGLDQSRLDGIKFDAAAFTNLSHDHLDYHSTFEEYKRAKLRLFTDLVNTNGVAILNRDSNEFYEFRNAARESNLPVMSYGISKKSDVCILSITTKNIGQELLIDVNGKKERILFPLFGNFQAHNAICALCLVIASGARVDSAIDSLGHLTGVQGRLELVVELPNRSRIFIDYAHSPEALEKTLLSLKNHTKGNLNLVFGCGGDRDESKRLTMGQIAQKYAKKIYITDDNPRNESPEKIR
ncbi:MAG: UDP-N-acetylmuramoyl-L-alanyl-D-glutamate--2,6-diaminopimelate ligase, partial [Alphaproteobacteria bacterium MarineAlpha2_Bin1]